MNNPAIVFMGTPGFALPSLEKLTESPCRIVAVVTQPDRPRGRGLKTNYSPVKQLALQAGIKVLQPVTLKDPEFRLELANLDSDLIVTVAYGKILPPYLLQLPSLGAINLHASMLPAYRGAAPINRAIMAGDTATGITVIRMTPQMDAGDIILQEPEPILAEDTAGSLHDRLAVKGAHLLWQAVEALVTGTAVLRPQDPLEASHAPPLKPEEERINWDSSNTKLFHLIRGLSPFPGAYTFFDGKRVKILAAAFSRPGDLPAGAGGQDGPPGVVLRVSGEAITVAAAPGTLDLLTVQPAGRSKMSAGAFSRGYGVGPGFRFG